VLRGVLVGAGHISQAQLSAYARIREARIEAVCDLDEARARARAEQFGIQRIFTDVPTALAEIRPDFVDIATRPDSHLTLVRLAAESGCHVLLQKPMAPSLAECHAIITAAREANVRLRVLEMWRYLPMWATLRRLLAGEVDVGPVHSVRLTASWFQRRQRPVSDRQPYFAEMPRLILYEMGVHWLDCLSMLCGRIEAVAARTRRINPAIVGEDVAQLLLWFEAGPAGVLDVTWAAHCEQAARPTAVTIQATDGLIEAREPDDTMTLIDRQGRMSEIAVSQAPEAYIGAFEACQRDFIEGILHDRPFDQPLEENLWVMAAVFAAYEAAEKRTVVRPEDLLRSPQR